MSGHGVKSRERAILRVDGGVTERGWRNCEKNHSSTYISNFLGKRSWGKRERWYYEIRGRRTARGGFRAVYCLERESNGREMSVRVIPAVDKDEARTGLKVLREASERYAAVTWRSERVEGRFQRSRKKQRTRIVHCVREMYGARDKISHTLWSDGDNALPKWRRFIASISF